ncbi:MAG: GNAT family N-acetyltransferase [Acidimicrobiales bacterium]|nr:GNAT family N-acetyltransferase [Acidimicrobiales bacterium]
MTITMSGVHESVEKACWAPWLQFSVAEMEAYARAFPEGQITCVDENDRPVAALTTVRVEWDGDPASLGTWDGIAGRVPVTGTPARADGNAIGLLSAAVHPDHQGEGLADRLLDGILAVGVEAGVDVLFSPFRPSGFGRYKDRTGSVDFVDYCAQRTAGGLPLDPWLRILHRRGMRSLKVVEGAMVVAVTLDELDHHRRTWRRESWRRLTDPAALDLLQRRHAALGVVDPGEVWECGETGWWLVDHRRGRAEYVEPNLWGCIPVSPGAHDRLLPPA